MLATYEISRAPEASSDDTERTDSPDVALQKAGYSLWQASLLIHRADWLWAHHDSGWVIAAQVDRINADQSRETSNESLTGCRRIRLVCGYPCRKVDRSLRAAIIGQPSEVDPLYEIRREDGQIVRTTEPSQYLTSLGADPVRDANPMVEDAVWRWEAGEYGWYPAATVEDLPRRVAPKPPKILIRKISSPQSTAFRMVARLLGREKTHSTYEVATSGTPSGTIITTREPDVVLTQAGLNMWEASALISEADVCWYHGLHHWCSTGDRVVKSIHVSDLDPNDPLQTRYRIRVLRFFDVSNLDPNEPLQTRCRIRVLNGYPPRNGYVRIFLGRYLEAGIEFAIEYRDKDGSIQQVRTHSPLTVLTSIPGIDGFTAEQMCMNALWRWHTQSFGWSQP